MSEEKEKKKGIFGKAIDALSSRDEKEALEEAKNELEKAKSEAAEAKTKEQKATMQAKIEAAKAVKDAEKRAADAEKRMQELEKELMAKKAEEAKQAAAAMRATVDSIDYAPKQKFIAEHTLTAEETLSHLSLKYYGHATRPYWMVIYEANKEVIGDNPALVRPGLVLNIPELPPSLKDK